MKPDYSALPDETRLLLEEIEQRNPQNRQLAALNGIAELTKMVADGITQLSNETLNDTEQQLQALSSIREAVSEFKDNMPELPDYSQPIVKSVEKLQKELSSAISKIDVRPQVEAPNVSVQAPEVDLSGVEKVIKKDLAKAFNEAIQAIPKTTIPQTDLTPVTDYMKEMVNWLESIDTASRMKPQFPNAISLKADGSTVSSSNPLPVSATFSGTVQAGAEYTEGDVDASITGRAIMWEDAGNTLRPVSTSTRLPVQTGTLVSGQDYDYIDVQQTSSTVETYVYKEGGSGGTTVQTITVTYTDASKADVDSVSYS